MLAVVAAGILAAAPASADTIIGRTLRYSDSDGPGQILFTNQGSDPATDGTKVGVQLSQNGVVWTGRGFITRIHEDPPNQTDRVFIDMVVFTLYDRFGRAYLFRGKVQNGGIAARVLGDGRYERAGSGVDIDEWRITD